MTLHRDEIKNEVGVRELHDHLSRYLKHVADGGEVIVTLRGERVARLAPMNESDPLASLRERGLVRDARKPRRRARGRKRPTPSGSVSDLVGEQRR